MTAMRFELSSSMMAIPGGREEEALQKKGKTPPTMTAELFSGSLRKAAKEGEPA
ncbi:MAG: hypothetical protein OEL89_01180 [Candidatus Peregrinibacteria bacterium]|nr:hypothetical protein [Candidatus Peregrinibacteria bacterium]